MCTDEDIGELLKAPRIPQRLYLCAEWGGETVGGQKRKKMVRDYLTHNTKIWELENLPTPTHNT